MYEDNECPSASTFFVFLCHIHCTDNATQCSLITALLDVFSLYNRCRIGTIPQIVINRLEGGWFV